MHRLTTIVTLVVCLMPVLREAQAQRRVVVSPAVRYLKSVADNPPDFLRPGIVTPEAFLGSLRFGRELTAPDVAQLEELGVVFARGRGGSREGDVDHIGAIYPAWVGWERLDELLAHSRLLQVDSEYIVRPLPTLDVTAPMTGSPWLAQHLALVQGARPGQGIKIADIDAGIDVFHPAFFYPDGGFFDWSDLDGDGEFVPGVDGIDYDGDGQIVEQEILRFIDAAVTTAHTGAGANPDGLYETDLDTLYLDLNGNGQRDFGVDSGFFDKDPSMGEPMFLVDDVNRNLKLDVHEKLIALGGSKVGAVLVSGKEYKRGLDLATLHPSTFQSIWSLGTEHGTSGAGVLVGNTPGLTRYVGLAPYAELYFADHDMDTSMGFQFGASFIQKLVWARDKGVDVILFEYGTWAHTFMDGTSNVELAMDELAQENGILSVTPAGNLGGTGVHMQTQLPPGLHDLGIKIPGSGGNGFASAWYVFSLYWPGNEEALEVTVSPPGAAEPVLVPAETGDEPIVVANGVTIDSHIATSESGMVFRFMLVWDNDYSIDSGEWAWTVDNVEDQPVSLHGYLMEGSSMWKRTITFDKWESNDSTLCHPSTATSAITVGAYAGRFGSGDLRGFSGRGPRTDGWLSLDLTAPDEAFTPLGLQPVGQGQNPFGGYKIFGATSSASAHTAGAAVLLKQVFPDKPVTELVAAMQASARSESKMGDLPNKSWGYGKLDIYGAAMGQEAPVANQTPIAAAVLAGRKGLTVTLDASQTMDPDGDELEYRWDFEYDGQVNMPWLTESTIEFTYPAKGEVTAKVIVRDVHGAVGEALVYFEVDDDYVPPEPESLAELVEHKDVTIEPSPEVTVETKEQSEIVEAATIAPEDSGQPTSRGCDMSGPSSNWFFLIVWIFLLGRAIVKRRGRSTL